jgi:hypothetical protein
LQDRLREQEVGVLGLPDVALVLERLRVTLDVLLLVRVALLLVCEALHQRVDLLARLGLHGVATLDEIHLEAELLAAVLVLADDLRLIEGPLVGRFLLREQHLLHRVVAAEGGDGEEDREDRRDEGDAPGEAILPALVQLFRVR